MDISDITDRLFGERLNQELSKRGSVWRADDVVKIFGAMKMGENMSGGNLTVNQEKQMRATRNAAAPKPQVEKEPDLIDYMRLTRIYGEYRKIKTRTDQEARDTRVKQLAEMDEIWARLNT